VKYFVGMGTSLMRITFYGYNAFLIESGSKKTGCKCVILGTGDSIDFDDK